MAIKRNSKEIYHPRSTDAYLMKDDGYPRNNDLMKNDGYPRNNDAYPMKHGGIQGIMMDIR